MLRCLPHPRHDHNDTCSIQVFTLTACPTLLQAQCAVVDTSSYGLLITFWS